MTWQGEEAVLASDEATGKGAARPAPWIFTMNCKKIFSELQKIFKGAANRGGGSNTERRLVFLAAAVAAVHKH